MRLRGESEMTEKLNKTRFSAKNNNDKVEEGDESNIGSLRSAGIKIEIHTKHASRVWKGRKKSEEKESIIGIPRFAEIMRSMEGAIREDDPYADYWFHEVEKKIADVKSHIEETKREVDEFISEKVPPGMSVSDNMSQEPLIIDLRIRSKLAFQLVYCLMDFDKLASKILLGNHIAIIDNGTKEKLTSHAERLMRGAMSLAYKWRYSGVTRDDMVANNAKARKVIETMGECPDEYLTGELRSSLAPELPNNRKKTLKPKVNEVPETTKKEVA